MSEISNPGPEKSFEPIGKRPTGKQDQGNNIDVTNYAKVNTGKGGSTPISTEMECPFGKVPTGEKTGGL